jgi:hypothetical protein
MIARARSLATLGVLFAIAGLSAGQQALTQQEAASMDQKLAAIAKNGESAKLSKSAAGRPQRTTLTEREVNAYLKFNAKELPKGLVDPQITIAGDAA